MQNSFALFLGRSLSHSLIYFLGVCVGCDFVPTGFVIVYEWFISSLGTYGGSVADFIAAGTICACYLSKNVHTFVGPFSKSMVTCTSCIGYCY